MAKKNITPVQLGNEELMPTTIGEYSNKQRNPIGLFIVIALFIVAVIYLPNIQKFFDKEENQSGIANTGSDNNKFDTSGDISNDEILKYDISSETKFVYNDIEVSNITLNGNTLTFNIANKSNANISLDKYYLELYSSDNTFLQRLSLATSEVTANSNMNLSFNINCNPAKLSIIIKNENDYPQVNLNYDKSTQKASYVCRKDNDTYAYTFVSDMLYEVSYTHEEFINGNTSYAQALSEYVSKANSLNGVEGISASVIQSTNGYTFSFSAKLTSENNGIFNDSNIYPFKTNINELSFKAESKGFKCE